MKLPSFPWLMSAALSLLVTGCATDSGDKGSYPPIYSRIVTSDFEGHWIAEYVAEGKVKKAEDDDEGYHFSAVERRIFKPSVMEFHYPLGRPVNVSGPNVIVTPTSKPLWLVKLDSSTGRGSFSPGVAVVEDTKVVETPTRQSR